MRLLPFSSLAVLAACGASIGPTNVRYSPTFSAVPTRGISELNPSVEVPSRGGARYSVDIGFGSGTVSDIDDARVMGDISIDVDFERNSIDGTADRFVDRLTGEALRGQLDAEMFVNRSAEDLGKDAITDFVDGTLHRPAGQLVDIELDAYADFYGTGGRRIAGTVEGEVDDLAVSPDASLSGVFDVRR